MEAKTEEQSEIIGKSSQDKANAFRETPNKDLLKHYPNDKAIKDAVTVQAIANKFAQEKILDAENRKQFLEKIRDRIAQNIAQNKENKVPKIIDNQNQHNNEQER